MTETAAREYNRLEDLPNHALSTRQYITLADAIDEAKRRGWNSFDYGRLWFVAMPDGTWKGYGGK